MGSTGGFCAGTKVMCEHQRINSTALVYSAALPALLATAATETIGNFTRYPEMFSMLQENIQASRRIVAAVDSLEILSHPVSPIIHLAIKPPSENSLTVDTAKTTTTTTSNKLANSSSILGRDPVTFDIHKEEALLQEVVDEALLQGVLITTAKRLYGDNDKKQVCI